MARTIQIRDSDEVMALCGVHRGYYRGKWEKIKVTGVSRDEYTPLEVRKSLVGLVIPTIFTKESIEKQTGMILSAPNGSRLAYAVDVIEALKSAGKEEAAKQLESVVPNPLDMYVVEEGIYELVQ